MDSRRRTDNKICILAKDHLYNHAVMSKLIFIDLHAFHSKKNFERKVENQNPLE